MENVSESDLDNEWCVVVWNLVLENNDAKGMKQSTSKESKQVNNVCNLRKTLGFPVTPSPMQQAML